MYTCKSIFGMSSHHFGDMIATHKLISLSNSYINVDNLLVAQ